MTSREIFDLRTETFLRLGLSKSEVAGAANLPVRKRKLWSVARSYVSISSAFKNKRAEISRVEKPAEKVDEASTAQPRQHMPRQHRKTLTVWQSNDFKGVHGFDFAEDLGSGTDKMHSIQEEDVHESVSQRSFKQAAQALDAQDEDGGGISFDDIKAIPRNRTWLVILIGGILVSIAFNAIQLLILWFRRIGVPSFNAIAAFALVGIGLAVGGGLGGVLGDRCSKGSRLREKYAHQAIGQLSVALGIPLCFVWFVLFPLKPSFWWVYGLWGMFTGMLITWGPSNNNSIISDVFDSMVLPLAFSLQMLIQGCVGSVGVFVVAFFVNDVFDGKDVTAPLAEWEKFSPKRQEELLRAMGYGMAACFCTFSFLGAITFSFLYCTYPKESISLHIFPDASGGKEDAPGAVSPRESTISRSASGLRSASVKLDASIMTQGPKKLSRKLSKLMF